MPDERGAWRHWVRVIAAWFLLVKPGRRELDEGPFAKHGVRPGRDLVRRLPGRLEDAETGPGVWRDTSGGRLA